MHIAIVTETYLPEINGVAMTIGRMVIALRERGHRVSLVRPRQDSDERDPIGADADETLVSPIKIPMYSELQLGICWPSRLRTLWSNTRPDLVHVVTEGPLGLIATRVAGKLDIPITSGFHTNFQSYTGHYGFGWLSRVVDAYLRALHNRTRATFVPTAALASELSARGYQNTVVISRGINSEQFNPAFRDTSLRRQWGVSDDTLVCLYVGRLAAEKNIEVVAQAYQAISDGVTDARLVLVGAGPEQQRLAKQIPNAVFAGFRRGEDLSRHYASADLFLFASLTETFGNVTLEAMASGLPVVAFDDAAAKEVIQHGTNGFIAEAGNNTAFLSVARDVATNASKRVSVIDPAVKTASSRSWDSIHDRVEAVFLTISAGRSISHLNTSETTTVDAHKPEHQSRHQPQEQILSANRG